MQRKGAGLFERIECCGGGIDGVDGDELRRSVGGAAGEGAFAGWVRLGARGCDTGSVLPAGCCRAFGIGGCQGRCGLVACGQNAGENARLQGTALFRITRAGEIEPDLPDEAGRARELAESGQLGFAHASVGNPPRVRAQSEGYIRRGGQNGKQPLIFRRFHRAGESADARRRAVFGRYAGGGDKSQMAVHIKECFHEGSIPAPSLIVKDVALSFDAVGASSAARRRNRTRLGVCLCTP